MNKRLQQSALALLVSAACGAQATQTNLYWGDTHLHTSLSPDAFVMGNKAADPDTAYRYAKGMPVLDEYSRMKVQVSEPLDFLVVADHAEYMGITNKLINGDKTLADTPTGARFIKMFEEGKGTEVFLEIVASVNKMSPIEDINSEKVRGEVWNEIISAAEAHNEPGKFTTFIGWEWSSLVDGANLHRVVFTPQGGEVARKFIPYSTFDSDKAEDLWAWLEQTSDETGADFTAIPHNANVSSGLMFSERDSWGKPLTAEYAKTRTRWESVYEVTQIKGDSETHPALSPNDEFADFETYDHPLDPSKAGQHVEPTRGDYARTALGMGLEQQQKLGVNPFKFGMTGSTDAHTGFASTNEGSFLGKFSKDSIPEQREDVPLTPGTVGWDMSASGLSAVWAEDNTRQSIFDAYQRKEVYGTSGPRIAVRMFAGFDFDAADADAQNLAEIGYDKGVPMGGDLTAAPEGKAPSFLVHAAKDPKRGNLDRIQIVKVWVDAEGAAQEKVFDVAWSDNRQLDGNGKLAAVGNTVDLETGFYTNTIGAAQLSTVWTDPEFNPELAATYYARVLQIPTPRHSTLDAIALKQPLPKKYPATIQERAYTSPVWYTPAK